MIASTRGCSRLMNRALAEPNRPVIARSNRPRMALPIPEMISQMRSRISMIIILGEDKTAGCHAHARFDSYTRERVGAKRGHGSARATAAKSLPAEGA